MTTDEIKQHMEQQSTASGRRQPGERPTEPKIIDAAVERYQRDQIALVEAVTDEQRAHYRRTTRAAVMLAGLPTSLVDRFQRSLAGGDRLDIAAIITLLHAAVMAYAAVTSFVGTHALGWVGKATRERRRAICAGCTLRITTADGVPRPAAGAPESFGRPGAADYCTARRCRCPKARWWPFAALKHLTRLRAVRCPTGRW